MPGRHSGVPGTIRAPPVSLHLADLLNIPATRPPRRNPKHPQEAGFLIRPHPDPGSRDRSHHSGFQCLSRPAAQPASLPERRTSRASLGSIIGATTARVVDKLPEPSSREQNFRGHGRFRNSGGYLDRSIVRGSASCRRGEQQFLRPPGLASRSWSSIQLSRRPAWRSACSSGHHRVLDPKT